MKRLAVLVLMIMIVGTTGCGGPASTGPVVIADERVPFGLLRDEAPTTTTTTPSGDRVRLCLAGADGFLHEITDRVDLASGPLLVVRTLAEPRGDFTTAVPDPAPVSAVDVAGGVATVDLAATFGELGTERQRLAIAQIVCTLTSLPGIGQVSFALAGSPIDVPDGAGVLTPGPVSRDDYATLISS